MARDLSRQSQEVAQGLGEWWETVDEKPAFLALSVGGFVALWALLRLADAIDELPVLSNVFEIVGLFYSGWFVYTNLLVGEDRRRLLQASG